MSGGTVVCRHINGERTQTGKPLLHTQITSSIVEYKDKNMLTCWLIRTRSMNMISVVQYNVLGDLIK